MNETERTLTSIGSVFNALVGDGVSRLTVVAPLIERVAWRDLLCSTIDNAIVDLEAERLGIWPTDEQLQSYADRFRLRQGLESADSFHEWMKLAPPVSLDDFELSLVREVRRCAVRRTVAEGKVEPRFGAQSWRYLSALLASIVVSDEGIARELYYVTTEENEDFHNLGRHYSEANGPSKRLGGYGSPQWGAELGEEVARVVLASQPGTILEPTNVGDNWVVSRIEALHPPLLDQPTRAYIEAEIFSEWLAERRREIVGTAIVPDSIER